MNRSIWERKAFHSLTLWGSLLTTCFTGTVSLQEHHKVKPSNSYIGKYNTKTTIKRVGKESLLIKLSEKQSWETDPLTCLSQARLPAEQLKRISEQLSIKKPKKP